MTLSEALSKSKIATLKMPDKMILVTKTSAYEAKLTKQVFDTTGAYVFKEFKTITRFAEIPQSDKWEALGYHE